MDYQTFQNLLSAEITNLMQEAGTKTCVFPINGTRRWFMLEHAAQIKDDPVTAYLDIAGRNHIDLYRLFFEHGIDTLLTPEFGPDLLARGDDYMQMAAEGLKRFTSHPDFLQFYESHDVRVRFYGDYRKFFAGTDYAYLCDHFDEITQKTLTNTQHKLFIGVCAQDAVETITELSVQYYIEHGSIPDKPTLITMYYGEPVDPVSLFIGFGKPAIFDMPLLSTGSEDLYFTVNPSPALTQQQLRDILYDHLYSRREPETDYSQLTEKDWALMHEFYQTNMGKTLGIGALQHQGNIWYPLPQTHLPDGFETEALPISAMAASKE